MSRARRGGSSRATSREVDVGDVCGVDDGLAAEEEEALHVALLLRRQLDVPRGLATVEALGERRQRRELLRRAPLVARRFCQAAVNLPGVLNRGRRGRGTSRIPS